MEKSVVKEIANILKEIGYLSLKYPGDYIDFDQGVISSPMGVKRTAQVIKSLYTGIQELVEVTQKGKTKNLEKSDEECYGGVGYVDDADIDIAVKNQIRSQEALYKNMKQISGSLERKFEWGGELAACSKAYDRAFRKNFEDMKKISDGFIKGNEIHRMLVLLEKQTNETIKFTKKFNENLKKNEGESRAVKYKCPCKILNKVEMVSKSVMVKKIIPKIQKMEKVVQGVFECKVEVSQEAISDTLKDRGNRTFLSYSNKNCFLAIQNNFGFSLIVDGKELHSKKMQKCNFHTNPL